MIHVLLQDDSITVGKVNDLLENLQKEAARAAVSLPSKRALNLTYMGIKFKTVVTNTAQEWEARWYCAIKSEALGQEDGLEFFVYEQWLFGDRVKQKCKLPYSLFTAMKAARKCATDILADTSIECWDDLCRTMVKSAELLTSMDRSFKVELDFLKHSGAARLEQAVQEAIHTRIQRKRI